MSQGGWDWGNVPDDPDVRVASRVMRTAGQGAPKKRRHHYIATTYMDGFCRPGGRLWAYRLDDPQHPHPSRPEAVAYSNHYYSQVRPDGSRDDDSLEDLWAAVETVWPETMRAISAGRISPATSFNVLAMASMTSARVPAARQRNELLVAAKLRAKVLNDHRAGTLAEDLMPYADELETVPIGANPQQSIPSMTDDLRVFGKLCFKMGFEVLHNVTALPFITSDNPVCYYDPGPSPRDRRPYEHRRDLELIFPLDRRTLLRGGVRLRPTNEIVRHRQLKDRAAVARVNNTVAQFAYGLALASDRSSDATIARHAGRAPTIAISLDDRASPTAIQWRHVFAARPKLPPFIDTPQKAARFEAEWAAALNTAEWAAALNTKEGDQ